MTNIIVDTGPIVAFLNQRDAYHGWAVKIFDTIDYPIITCEAVISEACFLLGKLQNGQATVTELVRRKLIEVDFDLTMEIHAVQKLLKKYADTPMSFADACLVRMSELNPHSQVFTIDQDFRIYRRSGRQAIAVIMP